MTVKTYAHHQLVLVAALPIGALLLGNRQRFVAIEEQIDAKLLLRSVSGIEHTDGSLLTVRKLCSDDRRLVAQLYLGIVVQTKSACLLFADVLKLKHRARSLHLVLISMLTGNGIERSLLTVPSVFVGIAITGVIVAVHIHKHRICLQATLHSRKLFFGTPSLTARMVVIAPTFWMIFRDIVGSSVPMPF